MKIFILEANPFEDLDLSKEIRSLRRIFDDIESSDEFKVKDNAAASKDKIQKWMLEFEAEEPKDDNIIVHFCGHGTGKNGLVFEDRQGNSDLVSTNTLKDFFALFKNRVACVVMNACYSEVQAEAINQHIKYVIGMNQAIQDKAAIAFSTGFYQALGYGKSFEDSFKFGTNAIQLALDDGIEDRAISKEMRKLIPVMPASESIITQEYLKPILKIKSDFVDSYSEKRSDDYNKQKQKELDDNKNTLENPKGKVSVNSKFYILRNIEFKAYQSLESEGEFIRIKAPKQMGKSSFLSRFLDYASKEYENEIIDINLNQPEQKFFANINDLLGWIYCIICDRLSLAFDKNKWQESVDTLGANFTWSKFFRKKVLKSDKNIVLAFDNFDRIFKYPQIAADFCGSLRSLYHEDRYGDFFLIVAYSQESYVDQGINQSPFENIGVSVELPEFTSAEVKQLVELHQLNWSDSEITQLMSEVGGHPYLIRVALYEIADKKICLSELLKTASQINGCYFSYLSSFKEVLEEESTLIPLKKIIDAEEPIRIKNGEALKLYRLGLIVPVDDGKVKIRCNLYRQYFLEHLKLSR